MDKIVFFIVICFVLAGCSSRQNEYVLVQYNNMLIHLNYNVPPEIEFPFSFFEDYPVSFVSTFDVEEQNNKHSFTGNDSVLILDVIYDFKDKYFETKHVSHPDTRIDVFFCGKLSIVDSVNSFLISEEMPDDLGNIFYTLYLFNCKNNQLTSIVVLSSDIVSKRVTYMVDNPMTHGYYFSQTDDFGLKDPKSYIIEDYFPTHMAGEYVKIKKGSKVFFFSTFMIDENGFVKLVKI